MCILCGEERGKGVGTGMELQRVHVLLLLGRKVCTLCCRGLAWRLRWWGGKYFLLIGLKKAGVTCWLGRLILGILCGCNYIGVEIPLDELPISLWGGSGVL